MDRLLKNALLDHQIEVRIQLFSEEDDEPIFEDVSFGDGFGSVGEVLEFVLASSDDFCDKLYDSTRDVSELTVRNRKGK